MHRKEIYEIIETWKANGENYSETVRLCPTDNGLEFQRSFHQLCADQGIDHHYIRKNSPNPACGVIERSFRTDQHEFFHLLKRAPSDINELNLWFQKYLVTYNTARPHMGLNMHTPKEVIALY